MCEARLSALQSAQQGLGLLASAGRDDLRLLGVDLLPRITHVLCG